MVGKCIFSTDRSWIVGKLSVALFAQFSGRFQAGGWATTRVISGGFGEDGLHVPVPTRPLNG